MTGFVVRESFFIAVVKAYSIAAPGSKKGMISLVITPDKDYNQMVTNKVKLIKAGKSLDEIVVYDVAKVKDELYNNGV